MWPSPHIDSICWIFRRCSATRLKTKTGSLDGESLSSTLEAENSRIKRDSNEDKSNDDCVIKKTRKRTSIVCNDFDEIQTRKLVWKLFANIAKINLQRVEGDQVQAI